MRVFFCSKLKAKCEREVAKSKCPCIPLHGDGGGEIDPAAVGDGREGVEDRLVDVGEGPGLSEVEDGLDLDGGHGVDDERAEEEDDVVDGEGDQEDVEGVALHFPEGNKSQLESCGGRSKQRFCNQRSSSVISP